MTSSIMVTRQQAALIGQLKYFTGTLCKRGHSAFRYTKTGNCSACVSMYARLRMIRLRSHLVTQEVTLHKDDMPALESFVEALRMARAIMKG